MTLPTTPTARPRRRPAPTGVPSGNGKSHGPQPAIRRSRGAVDRLGEARSRLLLEAAEALRDGNFSVRLPTYWEGIDGQIAGAFNQALSLEDRISREVARLSGTVGKEGRLRQRSEVTRAAREVGTEGKLG